MGRRGAGRRLNDQERMEILEIVQREAKVKNVDLAKRYGVSEGAIRKLRQMKDTVRNRYYMGNEQNRDKRKRGGFKRNAPFEQELYQWIVRMRESQPYQLVPLTQTAVRQQAIILSKNYEKMANFKASPGWFARFCSRHRLDPVVVDNAGAAPTGDAADAPAVAVAAADAAALAAADVPQSVSVPPAVSVPTTTTADETAFLMDTPVEMVDAAAAAMAPDADEESKTDTPSINEQAKLAAREHNEAALRAAAAKIGEAQAAAAAAEAREAAEAVEAEAEVPASAEEEQEEEGTKHDEAAADVAAVAVGEDEIFSVGL